MTRKALLIAMVFLFALVGTAQAALEDRGFGEITSGGSGQYRLIYDTLLDITWLDYSNTQAAGTWSTQSDWAANLEVTIDGQVLDNWRLPEIDGDIPVGSGYGFAGANLDGSYSYGYGYNMTNSELGHLFYQTLGNSGYRATDGSVNDPRGLVNSGIFNNLVNATYWLGTEESATEAWDFGLNDGYLEILGKDADTFYGIAVISGDVNPVPLPAAFWFLGSGLLGILAINRKSKKQ